MAYTEQNFRTKKALKIAVQDYIDSKGSRASPIRCYQPGLGPDLSNHTGKIYLEGPHYPAAHTWYAEGEMKDGILVKVK